MVNMIRILVTGKNSYIGTSFKHWMEQWRDRYTVDELDLKRFNWNTASFSGYDVVFHVAGIAHVDTGKLSQDEKRHYYEINEKLAVKTAEKARREGVKQFIYMSSIIVYGETETIKKPRNITEYTFPAPSNCYGDSKWKGEKGILVLETRNFLVTIIRSPMVYGSGCKGNYRLLQKCAKYIPCFPSIHNERSMIFIGNLCSNIQNYIEKQTGGICFPQNKEYVDTSEMVSWIGAVHGRKIRRYSFLNPLVFAAGRISNKTNRYVSKAFGSLTYDQSCQKESEACKYDFINSILATEYGLKLKLPSPLLPSYSVLMSVYEKEKPCYLKASIESMLSQTLKPDEIVLVQDGTLTPELDRVIEEYVGKYPKLFHILKNKTNLGLGKSLNKGLFICRNELVARMDTDDISLPERCEKEVNRFLENPFLSIVGCQAAEFTDNEKQVESYRMVPANYEDIMHFSRRRSPFNHPSVMYRKSKVLEIGGYGSSRRKEDLDLFVRLLRNGNYAENLSEALLLYRKNQENSGRRKAWNNGRDYIQVVYSFYRKKYSSFSDLLYVIVGQAVLCLMPSFFAEAMSRKFLRKNGQKKEPGRKSRAGK